MAAQDRNVVLPGDRIADASHMTKAGVVQVRRACNHSLIRQKNRRAAPLEKKGKKSLNELVFPQLGSGLTIGKDEEICVTQSGILHWMT